MSEKENLPFKAINVFIEREYLENILEGILKGKESLSKEDQINFIKFFKTYVNVLGFRNAIRAPLSLQVKAYAAAFEEKNEVVPFTLSTWVKLNHDFAEIVKNWLGDQGMKDLALEREYSETEGFYNDWPTKLGFDKLVKNFEKSNPDVKFDRNDLILMALWISGQLPAE